MDLRQLKYFLAVAEEGTISAAARKLSLSQPPLSAQMNLLEEEIGCRLFNRGTRHIELTEAGRLLYERAHNILELSDLTLRELTDYREGRSGVLRIGVVSSTYDLMARKVFLPFHNQYPDVRYELFERNTYQLIEQLNSKLLDLAIVRTPFQQGTLSAKTLVSEKLLAVGYQKYFTASECTASEISLNSLAQKPLIAYQRWIPVLTQYFESSGLHPSYLCINDDARTSAAWANAGLGVAVLPTSGAGSLTSSEIIKKVITHPAITSDICILHNPDGYLPTIAELFLNCALNCF